MWGASHCSQTYMRKAAVVQPTLELLESCLQLRYHARLFPYDACEKLTLGVRDVDLKRTKRWEAKREVHAS